ncbi:hypothetical protein ACFLUZ_05425 [Chloroflexota bacterium]
MNTVEKVKVLVADDHQAFWEGLCRFLEDEEDLEVVAKQGFLFLADLYQSEGITAAEAERLITQGFIDALTGITLDELVKIHDNVSENDIRDALCRFKLSTNNVAGADKRQTG